MNRVIVLQRITNTTHWIPAKNVAPPSFIIMSFTCVNIKHMFKRWVETVWVMDAVQTSSATHWPGKKTM